MITSLQPDRNHLRLYILLAKKGKMLLGFKGILKFLPNNFMITVLLYHLYP